MFGENLGMASASLGLSSSAFATADAGAEYLATAEHYRHLARAIGDAARRHRLVVVTGNPPASPTLLASALQEAAVTRAVIEFACGPDLDCRKLFGSSPAGPEEPVAVTFDEEADRATPLPPIVVCAGADRLSDDQIGELGEAAQGIPNEPDAPDAVVLLAHSDFVTDADSAGRRLLDAGLAAHLRVQQLERNEVEAFIRHQLPSDEIADLLTAQRIALIALTSGGDPAVVNRLTRHMLDIEPDVSAPPDLPSRRYAVSLRLPAAVIICLGAAWLVAGRVERADLETLVDQVRDHVMPRNEASQTPAGTAAALSPAPGGLSPVSPVGPPAPPSAAVAVETTPEPAAREPRLSAAEIGALVARGDAFLGAGDIVSARHFFERAADAGDGRAAMRLAVTYDAAFLDQAGLRGLGGDREQAAFWYRRARELGESKAVPPLARPPASGPSELLTEGK
jgi:hypothetical protein